MYACVNSEVRENNVDDSLYYATLSLIVFGLIIHWQIPFEACIPPIDANTGKRMVTILNPNQSSRGRPRGSRGRNSTGTEQVAAIRNLDVRSHINLANPATTPDPVGTTPNIVTGNEEGINTGQA